MAINISGTLSADGSSSFFSPAANRDNPIEVFLSLEGPFGGGTVTLESRPVGDTNVAPVDGGSWTSEIGTGFMAHPGIEYRFTLASATGPDIDYRVIAG